MLKGLRYGQNYRYMYSSFNVYLKLIEFLIKMLSFLEERHTLKSSFFDFKKHFLIEHTCTVPGIYESSAVNGFVNLLNS